MERSPRLECPTHHSALEPKNEDLLQCAMGCSVPVVGGIPRFVASDAYAESFGLQWRTFRRTQLDSHTGTRISRDRLERCLGGSLEVVRGKTVLEVGCGAGRFTELLLDAGATVYACDLSLAVEANHANCHDRPGYLVFQADLRALPVPPASFDVVMCLGVIQHTPDPEATIAALARYVRPGGMLVIDHYHKAPGRTALRAALSRLTPRSVIREILVRLPSSLSMRASVAITRALLPLHRALWREGDLWKRLRAALRVVSPVADYYDRYPELSREALAEWALLDTHDGITDRYKHLRSAPEIERALAACGMECIETAYAGNGVEARARRAKPAPA